MEFGELRFNFDIEKAQLGGTTNIGSISKILQGKMGLYSQK